MLNVTESAAATLSEALKEVSQGDADVMRLSRTNDNLTLEVGTGQESDQLVEYGERTVLAIESTVSEELDGSTLDTLESPEGMQLILKEPGESPQPES
jgi:hypothetical protein